MSTSTSNYNADDRAAKRESREFTIGGKKYKARKKSNKLMKELIESVPLPPKGEDTDDDGKPILSPEQERQTSLEQIDVIFSQLAAILRDDEGNPPDKEAMDEELDFEDANAMLETIMPDAPKAG